MAIVDIEVLGAGVFGLSVAWASLCRGARVRVVDPRGPGAGASGGPVGALAPHTPDGWNAKKAFQLESLLMQPDWWAGIEDAGGGDAGYGRIGRITPLGDDRAVANARARTADAKARWGDAASWRVVEVPGGGWCPENPTGLCVHDDLSARLNPAAACTALASAIAARGGEIAQTPSGGGATVLATGHEGLAELSRDLGQPAGVGVKGQAAVLGHDAADLPQLFLDGLHVVPQANGTVAIGSTTERAWTDQAPDEGLEALIERARAACPALGDAPVLARWAGIRPRAQRRAPLIGPHPRRKGSFIANGGFKIGFGVAPLVAIRLAGLILDGAADIPAEFLPCG